ncbi:MAG: helix-turn-helix transcriptional regulator [Roseobacter sp.]
MIGSDVKAWRKRNGYTQRELQAVLEVKSRSTMSSIENQSNPIPRTIELALAALEIAPVLRGSEKDYLRPYPAIAVEDVHARYAFRYNRWRLEELAGHM